MEILSGPGIISRMYVRTPLLGHNLLNGPRLTAFLLLAFSLPGILAASAADIPKPQYKAVLPGLDYAHVTVKGTNHPLSIHIARLDRSRKDLDVRTTLAKDTITGLSTVANQAKAMPATIGEPVVGVNGDFFVIKEGPYQGDPEGLQILNGEWVSAPGPITFWVEPEKLRLEKVSGEPTVTWSDGRKTRVGLNQATPTNSAVLFTPRFGRTTHATNHVELVLENAGGGPWLPLHVGQSYSARVRAVNTNGNTPLTPDIAVLTMGNQATNLLASAPVGSVVKISTTLSGDLNQATTAIGGGPLLVRDGRAQQWPSQKGTNTYLLPRHPRTALGFNRKYLFLVEVDGRQPDLSMGMSFAELADYMKSLGCTEAMNLDGGGSSTFWLQGKVKNSPSDKHERTVANSIFIVRPPPQSK